MSNMKELCDVIPYTLIQYACDFKGITVKELHSKSRKREIFITRVLVAYMFLYLGFSLNYIGRYFLNRDHSSVMYYKTKLVGNLDFLVRNELRAFRIYLFDNGVELPNHGQFVQTVRKRTTNVHQLFGIRTFN